MPLVGAMSIPPLDTSEPQMPPELLGQAAGTSPSQAWGKGATISEQSRASLSCQAGTLPTSTVPGQIPCYF